MDSLDSKAFPDRAREREAQDFAMWVFLVSETLIFGAFILVYLIARYTAPQGFAAPAAQTSLWLGTLNTALLLTSSLVMALAETLAERGRPAARWLLAGAAAMGAAFLAIKAYEWHDEAARGLMPFLGQPFRWDGPNPHAAALFFRLYYALTGLHALHLLIGVGLVGGAALLWPRIDARKRGQRATAFALYWHFIDVVWVFLFAFFYLVGRAP